MASRSNDIGRRLAQHRRAQGMTQARLAKLTGLSTGTIYRTEQGANCFWATVNVIREALKMTAADLDRDLVMGSLQDIHPGGSAEHQSRQKSKLDTEDLG